MGREHGGKRHDPEIKDGPRGPQGAPATIVELIDFHARYKYLLMAHSPTGQKELGRIAARAGEAGLETSLEAYRALFDRVLAAEPGPGAHANALLHIFGYFRNQLPSDEKAELLDAIEQYRDGRVALELPKRLLREQAVRRGLTYVASQVYLED